MSQSYQPIIFMSTTRAAARQPAGAGIFRLDAVYNF
jgi:hypothetical protein